MPTPASQPSANRPVQTLRHRRIKATIWKNQTGKGPMFNVTVVRSWREDEQWHDSTSFGFDDLLVVAKLMYDAHSFISAQRAKEPVTPRPRRT